MELWLNYVDQIFLYAALALSLNLLLGYAGQVSVATAAIAAVGGYTMGYMAVTHHWNFLAGAVVGVGFALLVGGIGGPPPLEVSLRDLVFFTPPVASPVIGVV